MRGRPKLPDAKRDWIQLRVSKVQKNDFKQRAQELGQSLTGWIMAILERSK